jgi:hypothetical protein
MTTQIIEPTSRIFSVQVQIPEDLVGKKVAFSYEQVEVVEEPNTETIKSIESISDIFKDCRVSLKDFKFNRDEANDYE